MTIPASISFGRFSGTKYNLTLKVELKPQLWGKKDFVENDNGYHVT